MLAVEALVDQLCRELAEFDPALHTPDACTRVAEAFARGANACHAAAARASLRAGATPEFLARAMGSTPSQARNAMAGVVGLENLPDTEKALSRGEISPAQAKAIASAPEHEDELLPMARTSGLGPVKSAARGHRLRKMPPDELHEKQHEAAHVKHWTNRLGNECIEVELPPEVGVPWVNRFDRRVDRAWRHAQREGRKLSRERIAAEVFVRMTTGDTESTPGVKADVVFFVDINAYRRGHAHDREVCRIAGGSPIPVEIVQEMMRDAFVKAVLHDGVNVHTIKHFGRHRKAELQTALDIGAPPHFDGANCTDEGCHRRYHLQWDHKDPFVHGGPTSYDNLQAKCGPDHRDKTERDRKAGLLKRKPNGP